MVDALSDAAPSCERPAPACTHFYRFYLGTDGRSGLPKRIMATSQQNLADTLKVEPNELAFYNLGDDHFVVFVKGKLALHTARLTFPITSDGTAPIDFDASHLRDAIDEQPAPKAPSNLTKCEQLIYDVAVQRLSGPTLCTREQQTQNIDYWLYQLQNANLARPKPVTTPSGLGGSGTAGVSGTVG